MNIITEITTEIVDEAKAIFASFEGTVKSDATKVVVAATQASGISAAILNIVSDLSSKTMTGAQKMAAAIKDLLNIGIQFLAGGGWAGLFATVEHFLTSAIELVFTDFAADLAKVKAGV